ncbi:hypothetical protein V6N11_080036 [Hibiscus sabdariffa]|uniref:Leucine--tRNA ligase n=1 Tax=Hibiscus sabdariffa TaxID=183260 RepID=A0ABR2RXN2_9ROSI
MYGKSADLVKPAQMTDEVWEFLFCGGPYPKSSDIPSSVLNKMKQEFEYCNNVQGSLASWIKVHWTYYAQFGEDVKVYWKFRTLRQAIEEFSADATRFSLADAGDGIDDANFVFETANTAILRLTKEIAWMEEILSAESSLRTGPPSTYADRVFENELNIAVKMTEKNYRDYMFREALKTGFYDLQTARDEYRFSCGSGGMNCDLVWRFMDVQTRLITPFCPHYAEFVWRELLKKDGFVVKAGWPTADSPDLKLKSANKYLQDSIVLMRKLLNKQILGSKKPNKKGAPVTQLSEDKLKGLIFVNEQFDGWQAECLQILQSKFDSHTKTFASDGEIMKALQESTVGQAADFRRIQKLCMPFLRFKKDEAIKIGAQALDLKLPFGEIEVLRENLDLIKRQLGLQEVEVLSFTDPDADEKAGSLASLLRQNSPSPGNPTAIFLPRIFLSILLQQFKLRSVLYRSIPVTPARTLYTDWRRLQTERRHSTSVTPGTPSSPLASASPLQRHARSGSSYGGLGNPKKAQTKAAAQRLAAVMSNQQNEDEGDGDDYEQLDHSSLSSTGSLGLGGGRPTRSPSPMARRRVPQATQADDDNDEDDLVVSGRPSIGLAGGRQMQGRSPMAKNFPQRRPSPARRRQPSDDGNDEDAPVSNITSLGLAVRPRRPHSPAQKSLAQTRAPPPPDSDDENDEDDILVSGTTRIGLGGRAARPFSPAAKNLSQKRMPLANTQQASDKESDEDTLISGRASIGLARGRGTQPFPSVVKSIAQRPVQQIGAQPSDEDNDEDELANSSVSGKPTIGLGGRARPSSSPLSVRVNQDQPQSTRFPSGTYGPLSVNTKEQSIPAHSSGQNSMEQCMSPSGPGRQQSGIGMLHVSSKPTSSVSTPDNSVDSRREKRLVSDFGSMNNLKVGGRQKSSLQDELDMLQDENESLLQKLHLAEERCEEAEARARLLEKQAALKGGTQTQGLSPEQIAALQTEAESARNETNSVLEKLSEAEIKIKTLQTVTQRMMLTEEEMVGFIPNLADIACVKYEYWSSLAPLPVEIVLAAGQRAREEDISSGNDLEERQKVLQRTNELSGERNVESMLLVEKGLRELALLKVEDAVAFALAKHRRSSVLKAEEVKLPIDGHFEIFELSQEESEDVRFKQAWITYFWRRAMSHGVEPDIADERLQSWINHSSQSLTSQDAVDAERGLMEIRRLGLESQLWKTSRRGLEIGATARLHIETGF